MEWKTKPNANSVYITMGAANNAKMERENSDFYATDPKAIRLLLDIEKFNNNIWECACGKGHLAEELINRGYNVKSTDLIDRGYGTGGINFLECSDKFNGDILTNPPYKNAKEFVEKALNLIPVGNKVIMFLKMQFLEGKARKELFETNPPKKIYISSSRLNCARNGEFEIYKNSAIAYVWFIWEKGYKGETVIKWFN